MGTKLDLPPPPSLTKGGGGGSGWVELASARDDIDAHLLEGRLHEAGIETRAIKDRRAPGAWLYGGSNPWAPVTIFVRRFQLENARLVLAEISFMAPNPGVDRRPPPRIAMKWVLALGLGALLTLAVLAQVVYGFVAYP
jgi:Putative prokaryotic signal transducing protein